MVLGTGIDSDEESEEVLCHLLSSPDDPPIRTSVRCMKRNFPTQHAQQPSTRSSWRVSCTVAVLLACFATAAFFHAFPPASLVRVQQQTNAPRQPQAKLHDPDATHAAKLYDGGMLPAVLGDNICNKFSNLRLLRTVYRNLGGHGPDTGKGEGLIWRAVLQPQLPLVHRRQEVFLHMNAIGGLYVPSTPTKTGMQGNYGRITLGGGSNVHLRFTLQDVQTEEPLVLPRFSLTFLDLDADHLGTPCDVVTVSNFSEYHLASESKVALSKNPDGTTTFKGTTFGTGDDNPTDPTLIGPQQKRRAVTLIFDNSKEVAFTLQAKPGSTPQPFTFTGFAALPCAKTADGDFRPPLGDLDWTPPLQVPVVAGKQEKFLQWKVGIGDQVQKGEELCAVQQHELGVVKHYRAPFDGVVSGIQSELQKGDEIDVRLSEKILVIIRRSKFSKLESGNMKAEAVLAYPGEFFVKWRAHLFAGVKKGQAIAEMRNQLGVKREVHSPRSGIVLARQSSLLEGDPAELLEDGQLAFVGRFPLLPMQDSEVPVSVEPGLFFHKWVHKGGDFVEKGDCIALLRSMDGGLDIPVLAPWTGHIGSWQQHLQPGMDLGAVMEGNVLAGVRKVAPLEVKQGQAAARIPPGDGWIFKRWKASVGSAVKKGDVVALVALSNGTQRAVLAVKDGVLVAIQSDLRDGAVIGDVIQDSNIAIVGRYAALVATWGQLAVESPAEALFKRWYVTENDEVKKGARIAEVEIPQQSPDKRGRRLLEATTIVAPSAGVISRLQPLVPGLSIGTQQHGCIVALLQLPLSQCLPPRWVLAVVGCCAAVCLVFVVCTLRHCLVPQSKCLEDNAQKRTLSYNTEVWRESVPANFKPIMFEEPLEAVFLVPPSLEPVEMPRQTSGAFTPVTMPREEGCAVSPRGGIVRGPLMPALMRGTADRKAPSAHENNVSLQQARGDEPALIEESAEEEANQPIRLDFHTNNNALVTREAWYQPLGIRPDPADPTVVGGFLFNSYAAASLDIERGWKIVRIGDEELSDRYRLDAAEFNHKLSLHMRDLPVWPLRLTFRMPPTAVSAADESTCLFAEQPLGIELTGKDLLKVSKVHSGSPACRAAVREGSFITAVCGGAATAQTGRAVHIAEPQTLKDDFNGRELREAVSLLPSSGKKYGSGVAWKPWGSSMRL